MLNYSLNESMLNYDFNHSTAVPQKKKKDDKGGEEAVEKVKKDRTIRIPKLYEFQFFDNFEELQALGRKITQA